MTTITILYTLLLHVLSTTYLTVTTAATETTPLPTTTTTIASSAHSLRRWIESAENGHVLSALDLRYEIHNNINADKNNTRGQWKFWAAAPFRKGDVIAKIPATHILQPLSSSSSSPSPLSSHLGLPCDMVRRVAQELALGPASTFAPLLDHLQELTIETWPIPSVWSAPAKNLLRRLLLIDPMEIEPRLQSWTSLSSTPLPPHNPVDWITNAYFKGCKGSKLHISAAALTVTWGSDDSMIIPLVSLFHHRNGPYTNVDIITPWSSPHRTDDGSIYFVTTRDVAQDEPLALSYNLCHECGKRKERYGTAELFRDYGWIEDFPQRWHYSLDDHDVQFELSHKNATHYFLNFTMPWKPEEGEEYGEMRAYLTKQVRRLVQWRNFTQYDGGRDPTNKMNGDEDNKEFHHLPNQYRHRLGITNDLEWQQIVDFVNANILAMTLGAKALDEGQDTWPITDIDSLLRDMTHYHPLTFEYDDVDYGEETCHNDLVMEFPYHADVETVQTPYQEMRWMMNPKTGDVVLQLDNIVQIASNYRPHYHEYSVHAAARFIRKVRRVVFVGGGDSMLLHEILKYPDLELVVGLELDQLVTRKSFQYFATQPHFDDPRVEWWFGDATKSLLLLPKDYWQSFDLVLVDLSETVMSLSVTEELDVFAALALLLKPEGILVKNEQYFEHISHIFDYSLQIDFESPIICDQCMVFGSNSVDFLHAPLYDHRVPTLLYDPMIHPNNRLDFLHDYRKNDARAQGQCGNVMAPAKEQATGFKEQVKSAGIMEVLDLEQIDIVSASSLSAILNDVIVTHGFRPVHPTRVIDGMFWILMKEGYVLARWWPARNYVSMDVNLWGRFDKLKDLSRDLASALKSGVVSNFRVVVGGMYGSSTWAEDRTLIGPQVVHSRNCEEEPATTTSINQSREGLQRPSPQELIVATIQQSIQTMAQSEGNVAVVLCGPQDQICTTTALLEGISQVSTVIRLSACSDFATAERMFDCERTMATQWVEALGPTRRTQLLLVDSSSPKKFLQIIDSLLSRRTFHKKVIADVNVALAWSTNPKEEEWRKYFLECYRRHYLDDPISRSELTIKVRHEEDKQVSLVEFGIVVCGNTRAQYALRDTEIALQEHYASVPTVSFSLDTIYGGKYPFLDSWNPKEFLQTDYDNRPGLDQYYGQEPLAHHVIFQLEATDPKVTISMESLKSMLQVALALVEMDCTYEEASDNYETKESGLGEGGVLVCLNPTKGSVILTWDGRSHVDVSYYRFGPNTSSGMKHFRDALFLHPASLIEQQQQQQQQQPPTQTNPPQSILQDEMPRGVGRTLNPVSDLKTKKQVQHRLERLRSALLRGLAMEDDFEEDMKLDEYMKREDDDEEDEHDDGMDDSIHKEL